MPKSVDMYPYLLPMSGRVYWHLNNDNFQSVSFFFSATQVRSSAGIHHLVVCKLPHLVCSSQRTTWWRYWNFSLIILQIVVIGTILVGGDRFILSFYLLVLVGKRIVIWRVEGKIVHYFVLPLLITSHGLISNPTTFSLKQSNLTHK